MGEVVEFRGVKDAVRYGDEWRRHAQRLEALLLLVEAQRDASDLLLRHAEEELAKYRKAL